MPRWRILVAALQDEAEGRVMVVVVVVVVVKGKRYYEDGLAGVKGEERWSTTWAQKTLGVNGPLKGFRRQHERRAVLGGEGVLPRPASLSHGRTPATQWMVLPCCLQE